MNDEVKKFSTPLGEYSYMPKSLAGDLDTGAGVSINKEKGIIEEFNQNHAVIRSNGNARIVNEDEKTLTFSTATDFRLFHRNRGKIEDPSSGKDVAIADYWLDSPRRRQYKQMEFLPGHEGHIDRDTYNMWEGWKVKPIQGDCSLFLDHIENNLCSGNQDHYKYLVSWMADAVQNPTVRPGVAVALKGNKGTGKGVFATWFGKLFGGHYLQITQSNQLTGNFNAHLQHSLLVFVDEGYWAGGKQGEGALKSMITDDKIMIEPKGINAYQASNYLRLVIATNNDWVVPATGKERRYFVMEVSDRKMQDRDYFGKLDGQMENGGLEALMYFLRNYRIDANVGVAPKTDELFKQTILTESPFVRFFYDKLQSGDVPNSPVSKKVFQQQFKDYCDSNGEKTYRVAQTVGSEIKKICPKVKEARLSINGTRERCYEFPTLDECRKQFDEYMGMDVEWEQIEEPTNEPVDYGLPWGLTGPSGVQGVSNQSIM